MCIDIIREFLEFYRMDYTLSTFLPECSLSQEPKTRQEIEQKVGLDNCNTSMPLLMHLINAVKNGAASGRSPQVNNLVSENKPEPKEEKPEIEGSLWENKNMDLKGQLDSNAKKTPPSQEKPGNKLSPLGDLPPLTQKKGLEPLDFNPKEDLSDSVDREKKNLSEVDKKLKQFESDSMKMEMDRASPDTKAQKFGTKNRVNKPAADDYDDDFEDDIVEDLPVEDFEASEKKDKNPEFGESGMSGSQSMGMDPSVQSLDVEEYDYVEKAIINSPFK